MRTTHSTQRIDSHQHYWKLANFHYQWPEAINHDCLPPDLEPQLFAAAIDRTIVVQVLNQVDETRWLLELARTHFSIAGVVGWIDLTADEDQIAAELDSLHRDARLVGVRHLVHEEQDVNWIIRDDVQRGLSVLESMGVPFDLLLRPQHLAHVPRLSARHPRLKMVVDHIAKPVIRQGLVEPWATDLRTAALNPNVWCKLSGMVTEADPSHWTPKTLAPYIDVALDAFGFERVMFGSDWPVCTLVAPYDRVIGALREILGESLVSATESKIFGANAMAFYGIVD